MFLISCPPPPSYFHPLEDHRRSSGSRSQDSADGQDIQVPEQFSGLLHGSSPICEISEDPFRLVSSTEKGGTEATSHPPAMQLEDADLPAPGSVRTSSPDQNQKVVYATVQHAHVNRADPETVVTPHVLQHPGGAEEEGDRAVGRAHPGSKPKAELKLSRSLSKSDSDLLTCSPTEDDAMGSRSESLSNCSTGKKRLEKSPSFASEWDEVRLTLLKSFCARNESEQHELLSTTLAFRGGRGFSLLLLTLIALTGKCSRVSF